MNFSLKNEFRLFFEIRKRDRTWHIPLMAALCIGTLLLMGWYFGRIDLGASACLGGLVILYLPRAGVTATMVTLITCSFGFMVSHALGLLFSFNANAAALTVGAFSGLIHWIKNYFGMRPPGNFFFIMLMSVGACQPFHPADIPMRIGLLGLEPCSPVCSRWRIAFTGSAKGKKSSRT